MRRRILTILLAVFVLAVVVRLGAAVTLDRRLPLAGHPLRVTTVAPPAVADQAALPESAALALTGSVLIGLAAAVRRVG